MFIYQFGAERDDDQKKTTPYTLIFADHIFLDIDECPYTKRK